jgi:hypothetical protein
VSRHDIGLATGQDSSATWSGPCRREGSPSCVLQKKKNILQNTLTNETILNFFFFFEQWNNFSLKIDNHYGLETEKSLKAVEEINKGNSSTQT